MTPPRFAINPAEGQVAQLTAAGYCYMQNRHRDQRFDGMPTDQRGRVALEDFGFEVTVDQLGFARFRRTAEGVATYKDGTPRRWCGADEFSLRLVAEKEASNVR